MPAGATNERTDVILQPFSPQGYGDGTAGNRSICNLVSLPGKGTASISIHHKSVKELKSQQVEGMLAASKQLSYS